MQSLCGCVFNLFITHTESLQNKFLMYRKIWGVRDATWRQQ